LNQIRLNLYPLRQQPFEFIVWRKPYLGEGWDSGSTGLYRNSLPIDEGSLENRLDYSISFEQREGFEEFLCKSNYNFFLSQHYLYYALDKKTKESLKPSEYIYPKRRFQKYIYYVLKEHPEGKETVWLEPYYLPKTETFGFLADFSFKKNEGVTFSRKVQVLSLSLDNEFRSNRNFYIDRFHKLNAFRNLFYDKIFPIIMNHYQVELCQDLKALPCQSLSVKKYVFAEGKTDSSQYRGIQSYGPLNLIQGKVEAVYIFRKQDQIWLNDLVNALLGKSPSVSFGGMKQIFGIELESAHIAVQDYSKDNLNMIVNEVNKLKSRLSGTLLIPVIILDKADDKTYFELKYRFLNESLSLQAVTVDLLRKNDGLKWSTSNIALQIFAKLGGQPWKVTPSNTNCIIFGIGQSHQEVEGRIEKYFAYSVSTDSSGLYKKLNTLGKSESEGEYLKQLRTSIVEELRRYLAQGYTKCALHVPFKIRLKELEAINSAVEEIAEKKSAGTKLEFVVLKVNTKNKFFGYGETNSLVPYESSYLEISKRKYLVWFEGLQFHRESIFKRCSGPVDIEFHWANWSLNENEKRSYLQDLINLSGANWRGFNSKSLPVSIYYCELVADFLARFPEQIENIENIPYTWFL